MKILVMGYEPGLSWAHAQLKALSEDVSEHADLLVMLCERVPTRELLISFQTQKIDALVLVDPRLRITSPVERPCTEELGRLAQLAIVAIELLKYSTRITVLDIKDVDKWPDQLSETVGLPHMEERFFPPLFVSETNIGQGEIPKLVENYIAPLLNAAIRPGSIEVIWQSELFLDGDYPGMRLPLTLEVAGRARILAYGPYLPLPAGAWRAKAILGFSPDIGKMPFILEADNGSTISRGFFEAERGGIFMLDLDFEVIDALQPIEFRLISQESALEGLVALIEVRLTQATCENSEGRGLPGGTWCGMKDSTGTSVCDCLLVRGAGFE